MASLVYCTWCGLWSSLFRMFFSLTRKGAKWITLRSKVLQWIHYHLTYALKAWFYSWETMTFIFCRTNHWYVTNRYLRVSSKLKKVAQTRYSILKHKVKILTLYNLLHIDSWSVLSLRSPLSRVCYFDQYKSHFKFRCSSNLLQKQYLSCHLFRDAKIEKDSNVL